MALKVLLESSIYQGMLSIIQRDGSLIHKSLGYIVASDEEIAEKEFTHQARNMSYGGVPNEDFLISVGEVSFDDQNLADYFVGLLFTGCAWPPLSPRATKIAKFFGFDPDEFFEQWDKFRDAMLFRSKKFARYLRRKNRSVADIFEIKMNEWKQHLMKETRYERAASRLKESIYRGIFSSMQSQGNIEHLRPIFVHADNEEAAEELFQKHLQRFGNRNVIFSFEEVSPDDDELIANLALRVFYSITHAKPLDALGLRMAEHIGYDQRFQYNVRSMSDAWRDGGNPLRHWPWEDFIDYLSPVSSKFAKKMLAKFDGAYE